MRVGCMEGNTAKYSKIQRNSIQPAIQQSLRIQPPVGLMLQAVPLAELERKLQIKLTSPIPGWATQRNYKPNLVRGHEAAIRLIDADNFVCRCCPAPLHNSGMFKTGIGLTFDNVLCHVGMKKHAANAAHWVRMQHLMRRLRLFARVAGRVLSWHARAAERAYAPGGRGFKKAKTNFQLHASSCV